MFNMQVAKVGVGVDPETACIEKYELGGLTIWDTPGLGDGVERDIEIATAIKAKLAETDEDNRQVIDMVLIVLDASTKTLRLSIRSPTRFYSPAWATRLSSVS